MKRIDRTGQRFGRLVIQRQYSAKPEGDKRTRTRCVCVCDCGNTLDTVLQSLVNGKTTSCGCFWLEQVSTSGVSNHPLWVTWRNIMYRCYKTEDEHYPNYGGRGITVCERWHDPRNFIADMDPKPGDYYSIDRIDVNGPYSPDNCRWATPKEQSNNKRKKIQIGDEAHTATEWCEMQGIPAYYYWNRRRKGLSPSQALGFD
jgi:hypothetical protein